MDWILEPNCCQEEVIAFLKKMNIPYHLSDENPLNQMMAVHIEGQIWDARLHKLTVFFKNGLLLRVMILLDGQVSLLSDLEGLLGVAPHRDMNWQLWTYEHPRWSIESKVMADTIQLECKYFDNAIAASIVSTDYVDALYAKIS